MKLRKLSVFLLSAFMGLSISGIQALAAEDNNISAEVNQTVSEGQQEAGTEPQDMTAAQQIQADLTEETNPIIDDAKDKEQKDSDDKNDKVVIKKKTVKKAAEVRVPYSDAELRLMTSIIYCESGWEPYAGKLAVGIVVKNRQESSKFADSIKGVIYQPYQFGPARNGSLSKALAKYDNGGFKSTREKECIKAAKAALSGEKSVTYKGKDINMKSYLYFSGRVSGYRLQIANHQFK